MITAISVNNGTHLIFYNVIHQNTRKHRMKRRIFQISVIGSTLALIVAFLNSWAIIFIEYGDSKITETPIILLFFSLGPIILILLFFIWILLMWIHHNILKPAWEDLGTFYDRKFPAKNRRHTWE